MTRRMSWACRCGKMRLSVATEAGARITCYCRDCRAFPRVLGDDRTLDAAGGTDLFQTVPSAVTVEEGSQHLACLKLSEKGPLRWYAACCNSALANTVGSRQIPFVSVMTSGLEDPSALGPVVARVYRKQAQGEVPAGGGGPGKVLAGFAKRAIAERVSGRYRQTPFFDEEGAPVARPRYITDAQRDAAYADAEDQRS